MKNKTKFTTPIKAAVPAFILHLAKTKKHPIQSPKSEKGQANRDDKLHVPSVITVVNMGMQQICCGNRDGKERTPRIQIVSYVTLIQN